MITACNAAVSGLAQESRCKLAMTCALIFATDTARIFGQPEIKLGTMPGVWGTQRLPCAVGKTRDLCQSARMMAARKAEATRLVAG